MIYTQSKTNISFPNQYQYLIHRYLYIYHANLMKIEQKKEKNAKKNKKTLIRWDINGTIRPYFAHWHPGEAPTVDSCSSCNISSLCLSVSWSFLQSEACRIACHTFLDVSFCSRPRACVYSEICRICLWERCALTVRGGRGSPPRQSYAGMKPAFACRYKRGTVIRLYVMEMILCYMIRY